ncbi:DUF945 family protein [Marinobacter sp. AL4B]|uniref:DUF945 family protein n=1 Tax=Marinobacter sp. AL4B TaxID=2871173 RepID=UPI001CAA6C35|nr:DUF945 family protein [Marinobacter sp. AL4B]MBZ0335064.1 YdgA family protein [Marinobacter sp. AL4B]
MKLNKWTMIGSAVLLVAGVAPWAVGYVTEQQWLEATEEVNQSQPFVRLETTRYQRGVFSAQASGTLALIDPKTGETDQIGFEVAISHGVTGSLLDFSPNGGWQHEGVQWLEDEEPSLTLETRLWGSAVIELQTPPVVLEQSDRPETVSASGGFARVDVSRMGEQAEVLMVWPELSILGPRADVKLQDLHVEQNMSLLSGDVWTGTGSVTLGALVVDSAEIPALSVSNVSFETLSEASNSGQTLDSEAVLAVEAVSVNDEAYGPHRVAVSVDHLDVASWNDFSSAMTDMQLMAMDAGADPRSAYEQQMALMQRFNESVRGLAASGFSVGIRELSLDTPEGEVQGSLDISHPELSEDERTNMLMVMQRLKGSVNLTMPLALAEKDPAVRMQLSPLVKQGLFVRDGDELVMNGQMKDLVLDINGVQIPLPPLL